MRDNYLEKRRHGDLIAGSPFALTTLDRRRIGSRGRALRRFASNFGLYGALPFADAQPVVRLSLPVIQTRIVQPGEFVGYSATWTADTPRRVARAWP